METPAENYSFVLKKQAIELEQIFKDNEKWFLLSVDLGGYCWQQQLFIDLCDGLKENDVSKFKAGIDNILLKKGAMLERLKNSFDMNKK